MAGRRPPAMTLRVFLRRISFMLMAALAAGSAAADGPLLIQLQKDGGYKVWTSEGAGPVSEEELMALEASARPDGGEIVETEAGPGRAYEAADGIVVVLPRLRKDGSLLLDRDACGHIKVWHAEGRARLTDEQLTELFLAAVPGGGPRIKVGGDYAKAFLTRLGVVVVLWAAPAR